MNCPICDRELIEGSSVDRHHLIPKSRGGIETILIHRVCHVKIHSLFSEKELSNEYNTISKLRDHFEMRKFIKWVSKKDPEFYEKSKRSKRRR